MTRRMAKTRNEVFLQDQENMTFSEIANPWVKGFGRYEPGRPIEDVARELGFADADQIIKLASNENALGPSPLAARAMRRSIKRMHLYPDGGAYSLRHAIAAKLSVKPDQVVLGNGSNEIIELLGHVFLSPGTDIVMASQAFVIYRLVAAMFGSAVTSVSMRDFTHDLDAMLAAVRPCTRIIFISNPNNPTSTVVEPAAIERFMSSVPNHVIVCFDEAYIELLPPERQPDTIRHVRDGRKVVVLRTFSKTYGLAGLRLGYGIMPEECADLLNRARQPFNVNAMAQAAGVAALDDDRHVARTRAMVARGISFFERELRRMKLPFVPPSANFILVEVGEGRRVFEAMQREGVIVRPMDPYGLPSHIRITIGKPSENRRCMAALRKVLGMT